MNQHHDPASKVETSDKSPATIQEALEHLQHAVELHRFTFLFFARPQRRISKGEHFDLETLESRNFPDKDIPTDDIDSEGEFLFRHAWRLEQYAQDAISQFGPGKGARKTFWRDGQYIEIEHSEPLWVLDELSCPIVEQSSDKLIAACKLLMRMDCTHRFHGVIKQVRSLAHDQGQSHWYSSVLVRWEYLAHLDEAITAIKTAEIDFTDSQQPDADIEKMKSSGVHPAIVMINHAESSVMHAVVQCDPNSGVDVPQNSADKTCAAASPVTNSEEETSYQWARQSELIKATHCVLADDGLNPGVLSRACTQGEIMTNGKPGRGSMVEVVSFMAWLRKKRDLEKDELDQVRNAILGEITARK